jgi:molecular chaperone GrpE
MSKKETSKTALKAKSKDKKENKIEKQIEVLENEKNQLEHDLNTEKDKFLRLFAEFENYKRRTSKERIELFKTAGQEVIQSLLPVMDDFDRALNELKKAEDDTIFLGVSLIHNKLQETLKTKGLTAFEVKPGDSFDADTHEAITQIPAPSDELKGKIIDIVEKGYQLGDKIIRYPKVIIGQ